MKTMKYLIFVLCLMLSAAAYAFPPFPPSAGTDDQTAAEVTCTPTGNIEATNVDSAIAELESEKLATSAAPTASSLSVDDLITLSGVAEGVQHLGEFTGTTITDNQTVKAAIQLLETAIEAVGGDVTGVLDDDTGAVPVLLQDATAFTLNDETPSVSGHSIFITANAATPTTISDFDDPSNGQIIFVIVNDASTTFDFTSSGLEGMSTDYAASSGEMFIFVYASQDSQWHLSGVAVSPDSFLDNCSLSPTGGTWDLSSVTLTLPSYDTTPVANPAMTLYDSDAPGSELADKMVARIYAEYIDGAEDSENSDVGLQSMQDGSWVTFLFFDESDDQVEIPKNLSLAGDLTITGDDIFATTNTAGYIWVGDDTNYNPVAVSGDISLGSNGATAVQDDAVQPDDIEYIVETEYLPIGYAIDGGTAPAAKETITSTHKADVRKFDGSAQDEDVYFTWQAPDDLDTTSGIKFRVLCMVTEATAPSTETWQFEMQGFSSGSGDGLAGTLGTAQTSNSGSRSDSQYDFVYTAWSSAMTSTHITDLAVGEAITFKLYRDIDDTDTYAQDVGVIGVQFRYKRNPVTTF